MAVGVYVYYKSMWVCQLGQDSLLSKASMPEDSVQVPLSLTLPPQASSSVLLPVFLEIHMSPAWVLPWTWVDAWSWCLV